jgi:hypothetical protein
MAEQEIKITPAMIQAGATAARAQLGEIDISWAGVESLVREVLKAALAARQFHMSIDNRLRHEGAQEDCAICCGDWIRAMTGGPLL